MHEGAEPNGTDLEAVQARVQRLATGVYAPITSIARRTRLWFFASAAIGIVGGVLTREPLVVVATALGLSLAGVILLWLPFNDQALSGAIELVYDHDCHERAEWRAEVGSPMPRGMRAVKQWLLAHPTGPGRASMLLVAGRLAEADLAIEASKPATPEGAFGVEIMRQTRILLAGGNPALGALMEQWHALPEGRERRHRRECLALLAAQVEVDAGRDPVPVLADGRSDIDAVYWTMRAPVILGQWFLVAIGLTGLATLAVAAFVSATSRSV